MRYLLASFSLLLFAVFSTAPAHAADCEFVLGFATIRDLIGHDIVGECLENEHHNDSGDGVQQTTGGLLVWRQADNWTAFTDGYRTWINGPNGLEQRLNTERFEWESGGAPGGGIAKSIPDETPATDPVPLPTTIELNPEAILMPAIELLRTTASGEHAYQDLLRLGVGITFGGNPKWGAYIFDAPSNRIVLYGNYAHEPADTIAYLLTEATEHAKWSHVQGEPATVAQCLELTYRAETAKQVWLAEFNRRAVVSEAERSETAQRYVHLRIHRDATFCPAVPRETALDPDIARALGTMRQTTVGSRVYQWFVESGVSAFFDHIQYRGGVYSPSENYIAINENHRHLPANAAAWLVHEIVHAVTPELPKSQEECYRHEEHAFSWQAQWWMEYYGKYGSGLQDEDSKSQDYILMSYLQRGLIDAIRGTRVYQDYCGSY